MTDQLGISSSDELIEELFSGGGHGFEELVHAYKGSSVTSSTFSVERSTRRANVVGIRLIGRRFGPSRDRGITPTRHESCRS